MSTMQRAFLYLLLLILLLLGVSGIFIAVHWAPDQAVAPLRAQWAPAPSVFIDVKGLSVHVRDEGVRDDPVPIVLIHGTSSSLHTWEGWVAALKGQRRVISMDLPGFGLTGPTQQDDYSNPAYTQFIFDLLETLKVQRFVVAGNSLGGEIAWQVAAAAPQRVDKLILLDAAGYEFVPASIPLGFRLASIPQLAWLTQNTLPRSMMESSIKSVYGDPAKVTPALVERYTAMTLRAGNRHALRLRIQQLNAGAYADKIKTITTPTLILWGAKDQLIPVTYAHQFKRDIAGSKLVVFDQLGHVPQEEDAAATVAVVQDFLREH